MNAEPIGPSEPLWSCDHCGRRVHRDRNGWYVGDDGTSDCSASDRGHEVEGESR